MHSIDLPYEKPYAVISAAVKTGFTQLVVDIRNPQNTGLSGRFSLNVEMFFQKEYHSGRIDIKVDSYDKFNIEMLKSATKIVSKLEKKLEKIDGKKGYTNDAVENIMRLLKAFTPLTEVRVHQPDVPFYGWDCETPLKPKSVYLEDSIGMLVEFCKASQKEEVDG